MEEYQDWFTALIVKRVWLLGTPEYVVGECQAINCQNDTVTGCLIVLMGCVTATGHNARERPAAGVSICLTSIQVETTAIYLVVKFSWTYHWAINRREVILSRFQNIERGLTKWSCLQS